MTESIDKTIEELEKKLEGALRQASDIKKTINQLLQLDGRPAQYTDADAEIVTGKVTLAPDQFYAKALATAVKDYLKMKGRATPLAEIYESLKRGGYEFNGNEKFQMRGLAISLNKNSQTFVYIKASNSYGLREFYPDLLKKRGGGKKKEKVEQEKTEIEKDKSETQEDESKEENKEETEG